MQVTTIGLDIAKNVFQVHGIDAAECCDGALIQLRLRLGRCAEKFALSGLPLEHIDAVALRSSGERYQVVAARLRFGNFVAPSVRRSSETFPKINAFDRTP